MSKINELVEPVEVTTEGTLNQVQNLNFKDILITATLGGLLLGGGVLGYRLIKGKKIKFKLPFVKKTTVEQTVVDEMADSLAEVTEA